MVETLMKRPGDFLDLPSGQKITVLSANNGRVTLLVNDGIGLRHEKPREVCRTIWGEFPVGE